MLLFKHAATRFTLLTVAYLALFEPSPLATASSDIFSCDYDYLDARTLKSEIIQMCRNIKASCRSIHDQLFHGRTVGVCMNATFTSLPLF